MYRAVGILRIISNVLSGVSFENIVLVHIGCAYVISERKRVYTRVRVRLRVLSGMKSPVIILPIICDTTFN